MLMLRKRKDDIDDDDDDDDDDDKYMYNTKDNIRMEKIQKIPII